MMATPEPVVVPDELIGALAAMRNSVVIGHVNPDADCLASMLAVARAWPGTRVCLPAGSVSQRLGFLVNWAQVPVAGPEAFAGADSFVVVDTAKVQRCNVGRDAANDWIGGRPVINLDHHETNTRFGQVNWVAPEATSCAELVYQAIRAAGRKLDGVSASLLYAGLHSDTRGFLVPDRGGRALAVAADLARAGARIDQVGQRLYRCLRPCELELLRVIYANTRRTAGGRVAYSTADHAEITGAGCRAEDIDEQVEVPRSLEGAALAMLFTEGVPGRVRVNLRASPGYTVLPLAQAIGGGGHAQAAGAALEGNIPAVLERVLPLAEQLLDSLRVD